jgi:cytochrome P450
MVLAWLVHAVASRRSVRARVNEELDAAPADPARIASLPYLDGVVRESMRYHSVVPLGSARLATHETAIGEHVVPAGAMVNVSLHLLHRRADVYERPDELRPERFIGGSRPGAHEWAPFGGGTRRCLGMTFAVAEVKLVAATLFSRLDVASRAWARPVRRGAFVAPEDGLPVILSPRSVVRDALRAQEAT